MQYFKNNLKFLSPKQNQLVVTKHKTASLSGKEDNELLKAKALHPVIRASLGVTAETI